MYNKKLFFILSLIPFFIYCSTNHSQDEKNYFLNLVCGIKIPSLSPHPDINQLSVPFNYEAQLLTSRRLYTKFIFYVIRHFNLEPKKILFWKANKTHTNGEIYYHNAEHDRDAIIHVVVPQPIRHHLGVIPHELGHLALFYKTLYHNTYYTYYKMLNEWLYWDMAIVKNIKLANKVENSAKKTITRSHLIELLCDTYQAVTTNNLTSTLKLIQSYIKDFENEIKRSKALKEIRDPFSTVHHPSNEERVRHLKKIQTLLINNNQEEIHAWIENTEIMITQNPQYFLPRLPL